MKQTGKANPPEGRPESPAQQPTLVLSRPMLATLAVLILAPWVMVMVIFQANQRSAPPNPKATAVPNILTVGSPTNRLFVSKPGPWGQLEYTRIAIEPPAEFLYADNTNQPLPRWVFRGYTKDQTLELLKGAELTTEEFSTITQKTPWEVTPNGVTLQLERPLVLALGQRARQKIYSVLAHFPENVPQNNAYSMRRELLDERFEGSGLRPETIALVKRLLYPHGNLLLFADMELLIATLPSHQERMQLMKSLSRRVSLLIKLKVDERSNIDELVNYWGFDGRSKDLRPLLESLKRIPGGGSMDIAHLVPPFARQRIYTYPYPTKDPVLSRRDCHWTSFNFFNEQPNDSFVDNAYVRKAVQNDYYPISTGARLGDIIFLLKPNGEIVHSAVYIADDLVFTKNGAAFTQPWTFMSIQHLQAYYSAFYPPEQPLEVMFYRRKNS
jgi:hypothetical protein